MFVAGFAAVAPGGKFLAMLNCIYCYYGAPAAAAVVVVAVAVVIALFVVGTADVVAAFICCDIVLIVPILCCCGKSYEYSLAVSLSISAKKSHKLRMILGLVLPTK